MGPWQNGSGQPITDAGGAIVECADNPCTPCGVADGCHYALVVCNANSQVDDDFIIRLNGYLLGNFDGNAGGCCGNLFVTDSGIPLSDVPMSTCCADGVVKSTVPASRFQPVNTLRMNNSATNNNNNWGIIAVWRLFYSGGSLVYRFLCYSDVYAGATGESFTFSFSDCECEVAACCEAAGGGPTAIIAVEQTGPCQWTLTSESTAGTCGSLVSCEWTYRINEDNEDVPSVEGSVSGCTLNLSPELYCGTRQVTVQLKVTDSQGCEAFASETLDCEECEPIAELTATLIDDDEEAGTCTYNLCASITGGTAEDCGGLGAFINVTLDGACTPPCDDCEDIGSGGCCGFNLYHGECQEVTVSAGASAYWRLWSRICGCSGDLNVLPLPCAGCECCEDLTGNIESASITIGGIANGDGEVCDDCASANGLYIVPAQGCAGAEEFDIDPNCLEGFETPTISVVWQLLCDDPDSVTLRVDVTLAGGVPSATFQETIVRPAPGEPVDCSTLGSALALTSCNCSGTAQYRCDFNAITASLTFNLL